METIENLKSHVNKLELVIESLKLQLSTSHDLINQLMEFKDVQKIQSSSKDNQVPSLVMNESQDNCPICLDIISDRKVTTVCSHLFHDECLYHWLENSKTCPVCRTKIIHSDNICNAITQKEKRCRNKKTRGSVNCALHKRLLGF